eukprot:gene6208-6681_t
MAFAQGRSVFVGNLPINCSEENLKQLFSPFGQISSIRLKKSDDPHRSHLSYGFVDFWKPSSAIAAMQLNNSLFGGRTIRVAPAEEAASRRLMKGQNLQEDPFRSGYAFVHYSMNDAGIRSALAAVECLN